LEFFRLNIGTSDIGGFTRIDRSLLESPGKVLEFFVSNRVGTLINAQRQGMQRFQQNKHDEVKGNAEMMLWCSGNS